MSKIAASHVTTHDDGSFIRTAIVAEEKGTSFDVVDTEGNRLCVINVFPYRAGPLDVVNHIIVDVIDVDENFPKKFALVFINGQREFLHCDSSNLVCADFRTS